MYHAALLCEFCLQLSDKLDQCMCSLKRYSIRSMAALTGNKAESYDFVFWGGGGGG